MSKKQKHDKKKEKKPSSHAVSDHEKKEKSGASKEAVTELQQRIATLEKQLSEIIDSGILNGNKQSNKKDPNRIRSSKLRYTPGIALKPEARIIDKASCLTQK
jgi:molecular chaperone GrpE (heat shock protein)